MPTLDTLRADRRLADCPDPLLAQLAATMDEVERLDRLIQGRETIKTRFGVRRNPLAVARDEARKASIQLWKLALARKKGSSPLPSPDRDPIDDLVGP